MSPNALLTWCLDKPVKLHFCRRVATSAKICNHVLDHGPIATILASGLASRSNDLACYHFYHIILYYITRYNDIRNVFLDVVIEYNI